MKYLYLLSQVSGHNYIFGSIDFFGSRGYFCSVSLECHFAPSRNRPHKRRRSIQQKVPLLKTRSYILNVGPGHF
ncbi:Glycosyl transferase [Pseudomonas syringae pv. actinidiae]|uniref:Glycosyl transferase n=1 Tax=Pseudomonas syringae pv. actinidiae TaxID=103796 RepID=A0AAN4TPT2_PSESF|nr:Glycosyl transferase [Pseudomonas syringae pv. actinidiae]